MSAYQQCGREADEPRTGGSRASLGTLRTVVFTLYTRVDMSGDVWVWGGSRGGSHWGAQPLRRVGVPRVAYAVPEVCMSGYPRM